MLDYIKKVISVPLKDQQLFRNIIHYEAKLGGQLFGKIPDNHRREFFCLDEYTWVWHEEYLDESGRRQSLTTRYDVRTNGIFKIQGNLPHRRLNDDELQNFYHAVKLYGQKIGAELQGMIAQT